MRAMLLALVGAGVALGAGPRASLTPLQEGLRRARDAHGAAALAAWKEVKSEEAITRMNTALRAQLCLHGPWHRETSTTASWLAYCHRARRERRQEAGAWGVLYEARRRLYGEEHWGVLYEYSPP